MSSPRNRTGLSNRLRRPEVPSWLGSMVLHALALLVLAFAMRYAPQRGTTAERSAEVGIALKHTDGKTEYYESEADSGAAEASASDSLDPNDLLAEALADSSASDPSDRLPKATSALGAGSIEQTGPLNPGAAHGAPAGAGGLGGKAAVNVFGTQGVGNKFVYVFDRSLSMGDSGRSPLGVAKAEMIGSLDSLGDTHQFQIIFYNEKPFPWNDGKLAFGTEQNKERARRFIGSITAAGRTEHEDALKLAIKMHPDVIFFLTDANEPQLNGRQLYDIRRRADGIQINAIEFGVGPKQSGDNFLVKLARQNGGQYKYQDITKFRQTPQN